MAGCGASHRLCRAVWRHRREGADPAAALFAARRADDHTGGVAGGRAGLVPDLWFRVWQRACIHRHQAEHRRGGCGGSAFADAAGGRGIHRRALSVHPAYAPG